ncbi:MAG: serine hydrolase domain-containing protein [Vicingaceae bacterium]
MNIRNLLSNFTIVCLLQAFSTPYLGAQELYFPSKGTSQWQKSSPSSLNYCKPEIDSLYNYLENNNTKGFILLKDGKIILEKYFGSFTKDSSWEWQEASHTLTAALFGIAQSNQAIDIKKPVSFYLGEGWTSLAKSQESQITVEDHLKMTSGLETKGKNDNCIKPECLKLKKPASEQWQYHEATYLLLENILKAATNKSYNQFLFNSLRGEIGMGGSYSNNSNTSSYRSNLRAAARFGLFMLAKGTWNNDSILTDQSYFEQLISPSQELNEAFGYLTWLNGQNSYQLPQSSHLFEGELNPYAPSDLFVALGKNGQLINVVPSENLVWVRFGGAPEIGNGTIPAIFNNNVWKRIQNLDCQAFTITQETENTPSIAPKPGKDEIRITTKIPIQKLMIADARGEIQFAEDINSKKLSINTKEFKKGTYYARIYFSEEIVSTQKFVVK